MKKLLLTFFLLLITVTLSSCFSKQQELYEKYTKEEISFINLSKEYKTRETSVSLHYMENDVLPYIDIIDYFKLLDGVYLYEDLEFLREAEKLTISIMYTHEEDGTYIDTIYDAILDAKSNTISVDNMDFFSSYLKTTETNYGEGLVYLEGIHNKGTKVVYDLEKYSFDFVIKDEHFLIPLSIANLIFGQDNYFDLYYNGDTLYGIDTSDLYNDKDIKKILNSSFNKYKIPSVLKEHTYNYYLMLIDYFYGLKDDRNIKEAKTFINKDKFIEKDISKSIFDLTIDLDDLHTSHVTRGYYNNKNQSVSYNPFKLGPNITNFYDSMDKVIKEASHHFGIKQGYLDIEDLDIEYSNDNKTLIIYVLGFEVDTPILIDEILKEAKEEVENVVIDLSLNTGGNLGAVLRMFTLFTNKEIRYHSKNPLNNETYTSRVLGEKTPYLEYDYYFKISSVTYSAANLTASIAKELGFTVIGQKSSGGASGVGYHISPDGSIVGLSSNFVLTDKNYNSIEKGIEPDIYLNELYNIKEILDSIK